MQRLGKNIDRYQGERIDIHEVLDSMKAAALKRGWVRDFFSIPNGEQLIAYQRRAPDPKRRLYISTGIHGDEPAGPLAVLEMIRAEDWP